MAEQEQDRTEAPTSYKLDEARSRGMVSKSLEINSAGALACALLVTAAFGGWMIHRLLWICSQLFAQMQAPAADIPHLIALLGEISQQVVYALSPLLALVVLGSVLTNLLQTGPVFSFTPLVPDFSRINPATGFKRLFSIKALFDAFKTLLKLVIFIGIAYFFLKELLPEFGRLYQMSPRLQSFQFGLEAKRLFFYLLLGAVVVAIADMLFSRWEFTRQMKMSRREVKDELRRREGDPHIRRRRRELQREMRRRSIAIGKVKDSDFLVTNPTHLAVAVKYRRGKAVAPEVTAKAAGQRALQMRAIAFRYQVPIIQNPPLARALYKEVQIGRPIAESHYSAVADILRSVYQLRNRREATP